MAQTEVQGTQIDEETLDLSSVDGSGLTNVDAVSLNSFVPGSGADNIVQLDGSASLPAVDGSLLTGVLHDIVTDVTPQLGGPLDVNGFNIVTPDITTAIDGTNLVIKPGSNTYISGGFSASSVDIFGGRGANGNTGGNITLSPGAAASSSDYGTIQLHTPINTIGQASVQFWNDTNVGHTTGNYVALKSPATAANRTWVLPDNDPAIADGLALITDSSGNLNFTGSFVKTTGDKMTGDLTIESTAPKVLFSETGVTADAGNWGIVTDGEILGLRLYDDGFTTFDVALSVARTGTTVDDISIVHPSSPTTPTDANDLTRKDYVDSEITYERLDTNGDVGTIAGTLATGNHTHSIQTLSDVKTVMTPTEDQVMAWDDTAGEWLARDRAAGGSSVLNDLTDVTNTAPADKHVLVYDGVTDNKYENRALVEDDISNLGTEIVTKTEMASGTGNITLNGGSF